MTRTLCGLPIRLTVFIAAVTAAAVPLVVLALGQIAFDPPSLRAGGAVLLFFGLALVAELRPVPMDENGGSEVSISNVFFVAVAILFGWRYAVPIAGFSSAVSFAIARRGFARIAFNFSMYSLAAAAASLPTVVLGTIHGVSSTRLTLYVLAGASLHLVANVLLVSGAISLSSDVSYRSVIGPGLRRGGASFAIMSLLAALAANLWLLNSWLLVLLTGPLFTLTLYQRSALHSRIAHRDAHTDNLTGLGNHRAYQAALRTQIEDSLRTGTPFSLCLVDVDNFKHINDTYGHPIGDDALVRLSELLKTIERGAAFRFGGDEFAVLVAHDELSAFREIERVQQELQRIELSPEGPLAISVGIATFPTHAEDAATLQRTADGALYWSKAHGKNRTCLYSPTMVRIMTPRELELETERNARLRAAKNLVRFVDARDPSTATHSEVVSALAEALGIELGLDAGTIDHLRLAGLLHDIGKIGLPDTILRAPRALTPDEYEIVKRHPEFGYSLLDGIGIDPVDDWILHHHERWDGGGYPHGLAGEEIPLGARIILVADAFEAMTADRPYRRAPGRAFALAELRKHAGSQFDPLVVGALERHLGFAGAGRVEALA
ncbi:MAG TPA: diguanylate cyclase [Gaiellaceae bacterium]|nr:diguanylate cyclase [Gaiellaceae bacterium]